MRNANTVVSSALAAVVALGLAGNLNDALAAGKKARAEKVIDKGEKCYGIAKAAKNDCRTLSTSCAGHSITDNQPDAHINLPKGVCERIVGGSLTPKT